MRDERGGTSQRVERLIAFARKLQTAETFEALLSSTREEIAEAIGYQHAWMMVAETLEPTDVTLRLIDYSGVRRGDVWRVAPLLRVKGDAMLEEIMSGDGPVVVLDARLDPRTDKRLVEELQNRTLVHVPLRLLDRSFGVLGTGTFGDEGCRAPSPAELEYLVGMASQLSVAAARLRLIEERRDASVKLATAIQASESHRIAVLEAALDAVVVLDGAGTITDYNAAAERILGYTRSEAIGQKFGALAVPEAYRAAHEAGLARVVAGGESHILGQRVELSALRKDGREFPAEVTVVRIKDAGTEQVLFTGFIRDITERREAAEAEALRRAKNTAEAANTELAAFSYSVAHDLRAPVRAMAGFGQLILEDYGDRLDDTGRGYVDRVITSAHRMGAIIDSLLALSQVTRVAMAREPIDLVRITAQIVEQLRERDPSREVLLVVPPTQMAYGDPVLLRLLLENLLDNAWKFTARREGARIELGSRLDGHSVIHFLRDNGAGFDAAYAHKLFEPFQRLHSADTFSGTGVGLATAKRIVNRHGGRIWAEGALDQGATIYFSLDASVGAPPVSAS